MISPDISFQPSRRLVSTCSDIIHDLLFQKSTSIEDILKNDLCYRSFQAGNTEISEYFLKNAKKILEFALSDDNSIKTQRAFNLFALENRCLIQKLLHEDEIRKIGQIILTGDPSLLVLSKYSSILSSCFTIFPLESIEKCNFLEMFFPFCSYHPVLNLFAQILKIQDSECKLIQFIFESKIIDHLLDKLDDMAENFIQNSDLYSGFYLLVSIFSSRSETCQYLKQPENLFKIVKNFGILNLYLNNAQWSSILNLTDEISFPFLKSMVPIALTHLSTAETLLHKYHLFCIDFLEKCLNFSDTTEITEFFLSFKACQIIKNIFVTFPNNSNIHIHLSKLLRTMLTKNELRDSVLNEIIPFACQYFMQRDNIILSAFCWNLIESFKKLVGPQDLTVFIPIEVNNQIDLVNNLINAEYGGPAPKGECQDPGMLPQITPAQLLMFFKRFR